MPRSRAILFPLTYIIATSTALVVALAIILAASAAEAAPATDPADFVRDFGDRVIATAADDSLSPRQRQAVLARLLSEAIDTRRIGRFVLGKYGRRASDAQRAEYDRLFAAGIVATYSRHLGSYTGEALEVRGAQLRGERGAIVSSRLSRANGPVVSVEWRLRDEAGTWRIVDVVIEGISMALTQRAEYTAVIRASTDGMEGLLARLRTQAPAKNDEIARLATEIE